MDIYNERLQTLKANNNYRQIPDNDRHDLIDLSSNDYLGINSNVKLREEFIDNYDINISFGATSSRLLGQRLKQHLHLESMIADYYKVDSSLLFNSGYHANVGILSAIPNKKDLIIADKLVHASVIDGAKLSNATFIRYRHLDYEHLDHLLEKQRKNYEHVFIVTESVFSMDGDLADLNLLIKLKNKHNSFLYVDESHAIGVYGNQGLGLVEERDCIPRVDFIIGTMGKAMASVGAFVVCRQVYKDYLINHARAFIFSTALPPINVSWSIFIFEKMINMIDQRNHLQELSRQFSSLLNVQFNSHIIPYIIGSNTDAIAKSELLKLQGFNALPIRYPTVPKDTARLRLSLNASMTFEQIMPIQEYLIK